MEKFSRIIPLLTIVNVLLIVSPLIHAERIRLDRKHGEVNAAFQTILSKQISMLSGGVGKIELGREGNNKGSCVADLFISPDTIFVVLESIKTKSRAEFYVDHPDDSFKDVLFQALVKQDNHSELSVDKKTGGYKFSSDGKVLNVEVKQQGDTIQCEFDFDKAVLFSGETE